MIGLTVSFMPQLFWSRSFDLKRIETQEPMSTTLRYSLASRQLMSKLLRLVFNRKLPSFVLDERGSNSMM